VGRVVTRPGIVTAVAGEGEVALDQRHLDAGGLAAMLAEARAAGEGIAGEGRGAGGGGRTGGIEAGGVGPGRVALCERAVLDVAGRCHRLPSGPLHDAAAVARAGVPAAMLFVQSLRGLSHTPEEDTLREHLELGVRALDRAATLALEWADRR